MRIDKLTITKCDNGYSLQAEGRYFDEERGVFINEAPTLSVIEPDSDDTRSFTEALLWAVAEWDGYQENKWASNNLRISWDKPGAKAESD